MVEQLLQYVGEQVVGHGPTVAIMALMVLWLRRKWDECEKRLEQVVREYLDHLLSEVPRKN